MYEKNMTVMEDNNIQNKWGILLCADTKNFL